MEWKCIRASAIVAWLATARVANAAEWQAVAEATTTTAVLLLGKRCRGQVTRTAGDCGQQKGGGLLAADWSDADSHAAPYLDAGDTLRDQCGPSAAKFCCGAVGGWPFVSRLPTFSSEEKEVGRSGNPGERKGGSKGGREGGERRLARWLWYPEVFTLRIPAGEEEEERARGLITQE